MISLEDFDFTMKVSKSAPRNDRITRDVTAFAKIVSKNRAAQPGQQLLCLGRDGWQECEAETASGNDRSCKSV